MDHGVRVTMKAEKAPIVLLLTSDRPVNWVILNPGKNRIQAVFLASNYPGASVSLPPDDNTPVYRVDKTAIRLVYKIPAGWWAGVEDLSDSMEYFLGGHRIDGWSGAYGTSALFVPSITSPDK
jgi:hypothetical protein